MSEPLVSICCLTYNHAPFIRKCLDGFLTQKKPSCVPADAKMSDWCEILIHDDCSTDGTIEILKEYEAKYPDLIFPLYEKENKYSNGYKGKMDLFNYTRAKGKYIAYCEGDDYWTDEYKLQKQMDFMEKHPEYSACFHRYKKYIAQSDSYVTDGMDKLFCNNCEGFTLTQDVYLSKWTTQQLAMMFRKAAFDIKNFDRYKDYRDTVMTYQLYKAGKIYIFGFIGGVYNITGNGIYTSLSLYKRYDTEITVLKEMWNVNRDYLTKTMYLNMAQDVVFDMSNRDCNSMWLLKQSFDIFRVNHNIKRLLKNIKRVLLR